MSCKWGRRARLPFVTDSPDLRSSNLARAGKYSNIHSLLVVRSGKLAMEEYFQGEDERRGQALGNVRFDAATLHDLRSVSKSITGALFGIAVGADAIHDLDAPMLSYFPVLNHVLSDPAAARAHAAHSRRDRTAGARDAPAWSTTTSRVSADDAPATRFCERTAMIKSAARVVRQSNA
jgi:CubicO group peptidase (beta-lactamase class C family)